MSLLSELSGRFKKKLDENNGNVIKTLTPNTITSTINEVRNNAIKSGALKTQQANTVNSTTPQVTNTGTDTSKTTMVIPKAPSFSYKNVSTSKTDSTPVESQTTTVPKSPNFKTISSTSTVTSQTPKISEATASFNKKYNTDFNDDELARINSGYDLSKYTTENSRVGGLFGIDKKDTLEKDVNEAYRKINRVLQYGTSNPAAIEYSGNRDDLINDYALISALNNIGENDKVGDYNYRQVNELLSNAASRPTSLVENEPSLAFEALRNLGKYVGEVGNVAADNVFSPADNGFGRFLFNLIPGSASAMLSAPANISDSAVKFSNSEKNAKDWLSLAGTAVNEGINLMPIFANVGGSGTLMEAAKTMFKNAIGRGGSKEVAKLGVKNAIKEVFKDATEEAVEEGVQYVFETLGEDGSMDNFDFGQLASNMGYGALGGAIMSAGGQATNALTNKIFNSGSNLGDLANENVQYDADGDAVKVDGNGVTTKLTDEELAASANLEAEPIKVNGETDTNITQNSVNMDINETQNVATNPAVNNATNVANTAMQEINTNNQTATQPSLNKVDALTEYSVNPKAEYQRKISDLAERAKNGDAKAEAELKKMLGIAPDEDFNASEKTDWRPEMVDEAIDSNAQNGVFQRYFENTQDEAQAQKLNLGEAVDALFHPKQPAYAMAEADGGYYRPEIESNSKNANDIANTDMNRSFSTYAGEGGKTAVKIDDPTLLENVSVSQYESTIKEAIKEKFGEQLLDIGNTDKQALVSNKTAGKMARRGAAENTDIDYRNKGETTAQLDEIVNNLHNVRIEDNRYKGSPGGKGKIANIIKGEVEVDINGQKIYPTVVIRQYENGQIVLHDITNINRPAAYLGGNDFSLSDESSRSNNSIVSQNGENVNKSLSVEVDSKHNPTLEMQLDDTVLKMMENGASDAEIEAYLDAHPQKVIEGNMRAGDGTDIDETIEVRTREDIENDPKAQAQIKEWQIEDELQKGNNGTVISEKAARGDFASPETKSLLETANKNGKSAINSIQDGIDMFQREISWLTDPKNPYSEEEKVQYAKFLSDASKRGLYNIKNAENVQGMIVSTDKEMAAMQKIDNTINKYLNNRASASKVGSESNVAQNAKRVVENLPETESIGKKVIKKVDELYTNLVNRGAVDRLTKALDNIVSGNEVSKDVTFARITSDMLDDINTIRVAQGKDPLTKRTVMAFAGTINEHLTKHLAEYGSTRNIAQAAFDVLTSADSIALPGNPSNKYKSNLVVNLNTNDSVALGITNDGKTSLKSISPRRSESIQNPLQQRQEILRDSRSNLVGDASPTSSSSDQLVGSTPISARQITNDTSISQSSENVNTKPTGEFDVDKYVTDQVKAQKQRAKTPLGERVSDVTAELKHHLVDDAVAYERYIKDKNERLNIREGVDRVRSSDMIAGQYMRDNGLMELGKLSTKDLNEFQQYLIAKRAIEVEAQGKNSGRNLAADRALVKAVGDKYKAQEQIVRNYTKSMLEYSVKNGLIGEGLKEKLLRENPNYVPMNRVMEGIEEHTGNMKSKQLGNLSKQTVVQKMKGSDLTVDNPVESLIVNTMRMINEGERNKTAKLIADSDVFKENRLEAGQKASRGMDTLNFMVDGEKVSYEVPKLVAQEMKNLNSVLPDYANNVLKVLGTPTKFLRAGATGNNPMFALSNVVRDQMQTLVTGSVKANIKGTPEAVMATFGKGAKAEALRAELSRAGIIGNEFRQTYGYKSGDLMAELQSEAKWTKAAQEKLKHPVNAIADVIGKTEYFTRAQQYFGTDGDATTKAQAARNNTLNFSRAGSTVRVLNRIIPFLNAGVQGGRATVNAVVQRPVHTTVMLASLAGVGMAAQALGRATDSELWDRLGDEEKKQNIVIFTPDAHYDSESNRVEGVIKIPVAQMLYPIMDVVNNLKGDASDLATVAADLFTATTGLEAPDTDANTLQEAFLPMVNQLTPTAIKPVLEATMNKNTYTGKELVSDYDSNKAPEDKGAKYTSGIAREIAKITGVDAPVVDNFIQNWGGGLATDLAKAMTDNPDNAKDGGGLATIFTKGFNRRFQSGSVTSQYEIAEGLAKNYKNEVKNLEGFSDLSAKNQQKVLNAIDSDLNAIASMAAKAEQGRTEDIGDSKLSYRQSQIAENGFDATSYVKAVLDKDEVYSNGGTSAGSIKTLAGSLADYEKTTIRKNPIEISDDLIGTSRDYLDKYNSMTEKEWNKFIEGNTAESAAAEYNLAIAKYENDLANGDLTDVQKVKRQKELAKLEASQNWTKDVRDAYSLAGNKSDMQEYLATIGDENRADMVGMLNGLNVAMYEAGVISESTYKSRMRNINNLASSSSSSGSSKSSTNITAAEGSALAQLGKMTGNSTYGYDVDTPAAPTTNRRSGISGGNSYNVNAYHATGATKATVRKGK